MRISDWSSDVCSSDLRIRLPGREHHHSLRHVLQQHAVPPWQRERLPLIFASDDELLAAGERIVSARWQADRKGVVWGKSVSVRVALGGRRIITKKNTNSELYIELTSILSKQNK